MVACPWTASVTQGTDNPNALRSAYFECSDNVGVFEWNTAANTFVKFFSNITGYVSVAPGDDEVLIIGYDHRVNVLKPQGKSHLSPW